MRPAAAAATQEHTGGGGGVGARTDKGGEHRQAALGVAHLLEGRRQEASPLRLLCSPEVSQEVFHREPEAKQQEESARNGVSAKVCHRQT